MEANLNPELYISVHVYWLKVFGQYFNPSDDFLSLKFWMHWLHTAQVLWWTCLFPCGGEILYLFTHGDNIAGIAEGLYLFLSEIYTYIKIIIFWSNKEKVLDLLQFMKCEEFKPLEDEHKIIIERRIQDGQFIMKSYTSMCIVAVSVAIIMPITEGFQVLPTNVEYPFFDVYKTPFYQLVYIQQVYYKPATVIIDGAMDTILAAFVCSIIGQMEVLIFNLENTDELAIRRLQRDTKSLQLKQHSLDCEILTFMRGCIIHHNKILLYVSKIENAFSLSCAVQFMLSGTVLCLVGLQLLSIDDPIHHKMQILWTFIYLSCMLTEVFILCWYGNALILKSEQLRLAVFNNNWINKSEEYKKYIKMLMEVCKNPMTLTAGKIFYLSLGTYTSLVKSSYNAFALMRNVMK